MAVCIDHFRGALSRLAAGVSIIATARRGERRGVTATAFCSVSAIPPTVLVCVNTNTGTCKMIEDCGYFAVNILAQEQQDVSEVFAGRNGLQGDDRFAHGIWSLGELADLPILQDAAATLECRVEQVIRWGTHAVFFGAVETASFSEAEPLVYHGGQFHGLLRKMMAMSGTSENAPGSVELETAAAA